MYSSLWSASVVEDAGLLHVEVAARPYAQLYWCSSSPPGLRDPIAQTQDAGRLNHGERDGHICTNCTGLIYE